MKSRFDSSLLIELSLLLFFLAGFIYMWVESLNWPLGAALFPRIAATTGVLAVMAFAAQRFWQSRNPTSGPPARILDLQWSTGHTEAAILKQRTTKIVGSIAVLWFSLWLIGFHAAIPLYLFSQLVLLGKMRWWSAAVVALVSLGIIIGVYDELLQVSWNQSLIQILWQEFRSN